MPFPGDVFQSQEAPTLGLPMTTVIAWRDPFCVVSDDASTNVETGTLVSVGPKVFRISRTMAFAVSGVGEQAAEFQRRVDPVIAATTWPEAETAFRQTVMDTTTATLLPFHAILCGSIQGVRGIAEFPPKAGEVTGLPGSAVLNPYAALGSGGYVAHVAKAIASRMKPPPTGEALLRLMALAGIDADRGSGPPVWRLDLESESDDPPYVWIDGPK
jgi:hypothetical protein